MTTGTHPAAAIFSDDYELAVKQAVWLEHARRLKPSSGAFRGPTPRPDPGRGLVDRPPLARRAARGAHEEGHVAPRRRRQAKGTQA